MCVFFFESTYDIPGFVFAIYPQVTLRPEKWMWASFFPRQPARHVQFSPGGFFCQRTFIPENCRCDIAKWRVVRRSKNSWFEHDNPNYSLDVEVWYSSPWNSGYFLIDDSTLLHSPYQKNLLVSNLTILDFTRLHLTFVSGIPIFKTCCSGYGVHS